ncbi:MAG: hypothetical protein IKO19_00810 [Candidatus Riflebacteria bacterium]|nr:hypothetical protein [Candidatus Riflebacteria bacterium]
MGTIETISAELLVVIVFAIINLQIQMRLIAVFWGRGCSWSQFLDIYDMTGKYRNWMTFDLIANTLIMIGATFFMSSIGFTAPLIPLGVLGIEGLSLLAFPFRFVGAKFAMENNPNLLDFNGKYKDTCNEYKKLIMILDERHLSAYKKSALKLWSELLLLNKRRNEAYNTKQRLEKVKDDVQKLITAYAMDKNDEKRLKAQARLNHIIKKQADIDEFTSHIEEEIIRSENVFMDIRTKLEVGQSDNILPDLSNYTNQVKSLEYTVDVLDGDENEEK